MNVLSRRTFLQGGLGFAAAALPLAQIEAAAATTARSLTRSRFTPLLGTHVQMSDGASTIRVQLTEIRDLQPVRKANDEKRFSLLFQAPSRPRWPQKIYVFRGAKLAPTALFAVPIGATAGKHYYEVVVNDPF